MLLLIGLTSDVVCVRVYYSGCVVILNPKPKLSQPLLPLATVPPLFSFTAPWRPDLSTRNLPSTHTWRSATDTHTHMPLLTPPNSHIPCFPSTVMECLKTLHPSIHTLCLSLFRSSESGGVISNGELIINSIKWVWLPWQIGLGYNIIISASSAVTTGHSGQMGLGLIGRVDVVTLNRNWSKSWVCLCGDEQLECDFLHTYTHRNIF